MLTTYFAPPGDGNTVCATPSHADERFTGSEIKQPGGKPIQLDYYLEKQEKDWKVYDIEVGGISLILNYRESFANEVRQSGIDGLIQSLQAKNKSGEAASVKK